MRPPTLPREMPLTQEHWSAALLLGEARRLSNEANRAAVGDRGATINTINDLQGAFAELFLWRELHKHPEAESLRRQLLRVSGNEAQGPDFSGSLRIDVKSHDCASNKKYFAINARKHEKLRQHCDWYWCVLTPPFGKVAIIGDPIPHAEVDAWTTTVWRYGAPAKTLALHTFLSQYCSGTQLQRLVEIRASLHCPVAVLEKAKDPEFLRAMQRVIPNLPAL